MRSIEEIKKTTNLFVDQESYDGFCGRYYNKEDNKFYTYVFSFGGDWEHLSVSLPQKTPSWDTMCIMKDIFWDEEEVCIEYHPRKSDYVNNHKHCLHIWKPIKESIPTPPRNFV